LNDLLLYQWEQNIFDLLSKIKTSMFMFDYDEMENATKALIKEVGLF